MKVKSQQTNEVDEIMKDLKRYPGFKAYIIMNNDGIVIRWDQVDSDMPYERAVHHASLVLDLCSKTRTHMQSLFEVRIQCEKLRSWCSFKNYVVHKPLLFFSCTLA